MVRRYIILFVLVVVLVFLGVSCSSEDDSLESSSVNGAILKTGAAINEQKEIIYEQVIFRVNEDIYFYFNNNLPFGSEQIFVQLIDSSNEKVLAESDYTVDPESAEITDMIYFGAPGKFKIAVIVDDQVRATQELRIE